MPSHFIRRRPSIPVLMSMLWVATLAIASRGQDVPAASAPQVVADTEKKPARGDVVTELGASVPYVFQAKNGDYWFGSNDRGVYRYDGKTLVNFTTKDGLVNPSIRGIEEDAAGHIYFATYAGISRFDGRSFSTLPATPEVSKEGWKSEPNDLWFVGPPDKGVVFRWDGKILHRLEFPRTALGDEHFEKYPRSKFPNAIYNPYDVYTILKDKRGRVWFGTTCVGVCRYDGRSFAWLTERMLSSAPVRSIFEDKSGDYWFTWSGGGSLDGFRDVAGFKSIEDKAKGRIVEGMSVIEDDRGHLWTAGLGAGASRYDGPRVESFPIKDGDVTVEVFAVYKDKSGRIWLGTHNGGAYVFNGKAFEKFRP